MYIRLRHRGSLFIEYALILAFAVLTGGIFVSGNGFDKGIAGIFNNTTQLFDSLKSFEERYPNNTISNFVKAGQTFLAIHDNEVSVEGNTLGLECSKDALRSIFKDQPCGMSIKASELNEDQIAKLKYCGLYLEDFPNAIFYKDYAEYKKNPNSGCWYMCWTDEDLSTKKDGDTVKTITFALSPSLANTTYNLNHFSDGHNNLRGYYVGEAKYDAATGSFTNNNIPIDRSKSYAQNVLSKDSSANPGMACNNSGYTFIEYDTKAAVLNTNAEAEVKNAYSALK